MAQVVCGLLDAGGALVPSIPGVHGKRWKEWVAVLRAAASPGGVEGCELGQRIANIGGQGPAASDLVFG